MSFKHLRLWLASAVVAFATACSPNGLAPWGTPPDVARRHAEETAQAFALRFTNVSRDARFEKARQLMGRYALIPARLHRDTSIWTSRNPTDSSVALTLEATPQGDRYAFAARTTAPYPTTLGAQRHLLRLRSMGDGNFEWVTIVDHGIGRVPARRFGAAFGALLTAFEGRTGPALNRDMHTLFPRSLQELGRLFHVDSIRSTILGDGSTALELRFAWTPNTIRPGMPWFAAWLDKYIMPARYDLQLSNAAGARFLSVVGSDGGGVIRARALKGSLVALSGAAVPIPDTLLLRVTASAKFKIFRVGFRDLVSNVVVQRDPRESTLTFRFQREPQWDFPLAINQLIRTPLRTPFAGRGSEFRIGVRDDVGPQTMSIRYGRLAVNESAIMRWLGNLGATAFGDFEGKTEEEENRFLRSVFDAMRADFAALPG